jgi:hypothetical protein
MFKISFPHFVLFMSMGFDSCRWIWPLACTTSVTRHCPLLLCFLFHLLIWSSCSAHDVSNWWNTHFLAFLFVQENASRPSNITFLSSFSSWRVRGSWVIVSYTAGGIVTEECYVLGEWIWYSHCYINSCLDCFKHWFLAVYWHAHLDLVLCTRLDMNASTFENLYYPLISQFSLST